MSPPNLLSVVIVAKNFNPSIFSQLWLMRHGIFSENDFESNFVFTPMAVNLETQDIQFLAVPDRVQLVFRNENVNYRELIQRTIGKIVNVLPETPYHAVGFNMAWTIEPKEPREFGKINRKFFLPTENPLAGFFKGESCRFGSYLSKDVETGRLRIEIKPVIFKPVEGIPDAMQLAFNFNRDLLEENKIRQIQEFLDWWDSAKAIASEMVSAVGHGWGR